MSKEICKQNLFPIKLNNILNNQELHEYINWGEDRITIEINDIKSFQKNVLALNFRHHNFESFARQMNLYGFKKNRGSPVQIFTNKDLKLGKSIIDLKSRNQKRKEKLLNQSIRNQQLENLNKTNDQLRRISIEMNQNCERLMKQNKEKQNQILQTNLSSQTINGLECIDSLNSLYLFNRPENQMRMFLSIYYPMGFYSF